MRKRNLTSRGVSLGIAFCAFMASAALAVLGSIRAPATLYTIPSVYDLGSIKQHQEVSAVVRLVNGGSKGVRIDGVQPSCACTSALISKQHLAPGEEAKLDLTWNAGERRGDVADQVSIRVTPDGELLQRALLFQLTGVVESELDLSVRKLQFSRTSTTSTMNVKLLGKGDARISHVASTIAAVVPMRMGDREILVTFDPARCETGVVRGVIMVHTTHGAERKLLLPISITE